jgi:hypothetical protein
MIIERATPEKVKERQRKDREAAISIAGIQMEMLVSRFEKQRKVSHDLFRRLVKSLLRVGAHIRWGTEDGSADDLEQKLHKVGSDGHTVNVDGGRIYIEGYFDLGELRKEILW